MATSNFFWRKNNPYFDLKLFAEKNIIISSQRMTQILFEGFMKLFYILVVRGMENISIQ